MTAQKLVVKRYVKYVCTVKCCGNNAPRFTPRPSRKCSVVYRCGNLVIET